MIHLCTKPDALTCSRCGQRMREAPAWAVEDRRAMAEDFGRDMTLGALVGSRA